MARLRAKHMTLFVEAVNRRDHRELPMSADAPIWLYDGVCVLCSGGCAMPAAAVRHRFVLPDDPSPARERA